MEKILPFSNLIAVDDDSTINQELLECPYSLKIFSVSELPDGMLVRLRIVYKLAQHPAHM
jgi:hypothetical protein